MASHSVASISAVFGGKNSNETSMSATSPAAGRGSGGDACASIRRIPAACEGTGSAMTRRSRPSQRETVSLPPSLMLRDEIAAADDIEAGFLHKTGDFLAGKAEPAMRVVFAQASSCMCGAKSTMMQPAGGAQHARRLAHGAGRIVEIMQNLMDDRRDRRRSRSTGRA